jgi:hypothetical protein
MTPNWDFSKSGYIKFRRFEVQVPFVKKGESSIPLSKVIQKKKMFLKWKSNFLTCHFLYGFLKYIIYGFLIKKLVLSHVSLWTDSWINLC